MTHSQMNLFYCESATMLPTTGEYSGKEVLYLRWNEHHLSEYFGTLITQL